MSDIVIYHNPRCTKSRQTLALLETHHIKPTIIEYLETPPDAERLKSIQDMLGLESVRAMMRTKEDEYKTLGLQDELDEDRLIEAICAHPRLLERPIVIKDGKAAIGRPPENVLEIL